ncbi:phosphatidylglycerophosphate phosphatase PTPMT2-like [Mercurialis annua]|uniref:phosphatidylglycerophosphate phosphatase PTPMT2-like n=1 Tax=Mercurialis annua TaxID=3986 RepID=UPI00215FBF71|nr:phosphatidylglycerophosphate phosphatase PTPMT2-like [Mercurialis annua]
MHIEEVEVEVNSSTSGNKVTGLDAKRVVVGAGARALFYPTLLYNVLRNKIQSEFRWWDWVDQFILLGAVPFPTDVPRLKELGVSAVVTLNESYETLVPSSLYHAHNIVHLVIPTRDYLFAPSFADISQAVDFIHENASLGKTTYVHCKAGRGRSTTIVLCYLVQHRHMTPDAAYEYVRAIRPRVLLASSQREAVQDYYLKLKETRNLGCMVARKNLDFTITTKEQIEQDTAAFGDGSFLVVTESDLDGYDVWSESSEEANKMLGDLSLVCRVQYASQAAISRLSCRWLGCHSNQKPSRKDLGSSAGDDQLRSLTVDIQVY